MFGAETAVWCELTAGFCPGRGRSDLRFAGMVWFTRPFRLVNLPTCARMYAQRCRRPEEGGRTLCQKGSRWLMKLAFPSMAASCFAWGTERGQDRRRCCAAGMLTTLELCQIRKQAGWIRVCGSLASATVNNKCLREEQSEKWPRRIFAIFLHLRKSLIINGAPMWS